MNAQPIDARPKFGVRVVEAAPARRRIAVLMSLMLILFGGLGVRVVYLGVAGEDPERAAAAIVAKTRAPLVDRNGALLAVTAPSTTLVARPREVWGPDDVAARLSQAIPELARPALQQRLKDQSRALVFLRRDLSEAEKARVFALGLPGIGFLDEPRRRYPNGSLAAHLLGGANVDLQGSGGLERTLDARLSAPGARAVTLSIDLRLQHAAERELADAASAVSAKAGAVILLDGRSGETLALASWPTFDLNAPPPGDDPRRLNHALAAVYEPGSVIKPLIWAAAIDAGAARPGESFSAAPFTVDGLAVRDMEEEDDRSLGLQDGLAQSSNVVAAQLGLRLGPARVEGALKDVGLLRRSGFPAPETATPLAPQAVRPATAAAMSYGYGFAAPLIAVAEAYTVFCNAGARIDAGVLAVAPGDPAPRRQVFRPETIAAVLPMMRAVVEEGTARGAAEGGVPLAGKTGTAEKPAAGGGYDPDRMLSSFAGVFPVQDPRYVILVALDEPARTAAAGGQATGGALAAPLAARIIARVAPMLGLPTRAVDERALP